MTINSEASQETKKNEYIVNVTYDLISDDLND